MLEFFREQDEESTSVEIDYTLFDMFLEEVKTDYRNTSPQLRTALDKFAERYRSAKSNSIPRLTSFLYDINRDLDPVRVKSGSMIRVQVESVKRRKTGSSGGRKRKLPNTTCEDKENLDPHVIPARKKVMAKKSHNLSMHIAKNQPN